MRILFTMTGSWGTGSGTVVEALTRELTERGHEIAVLYPERVRNDEEAAEVAALSEEHAPAARHEVWPFPLEQGDVELYTFPLMIADPNPRNVRGAWTFKELSEDELSLYLSSFQERFREVANDFDPDIVECHHVWAMPYAVKQLNQQYCVVAHHSDQMAFHYDERMQPYATEAAQGAEYIFAVSVSTGREVMDLYDVRDDNVVVTGNGYDQSVFYPRDDVDRAAIMREFGLGIPPEATVVTFAGKLSRTKGIDTILLANRRIREERDDVHFVIFGTGALEDALDEDRQDEYDRENVHFPGHQPYAKIAQFHNVARMSIMPSRTEGFGIAGLEAMGCGLPLVITRTGGLDAYAEGAVIEPEDDAALAEAVTRIADMPAGEYEALSEDALEAARRFSWPAIAEQRLEYFDAMIGEKV